MRLILPSLLLALSFSATPAPAQQPAEPPPQAAPPAATTLSAKPDDPFGETLEFAEKPFLSVKGGAGWEDGFETLLGAFRTVAEALKARNLAAAGPPLVVYLRADDAGFDFEAGVPVADTVAVDAAAADGLAVRKTPSGRALRFTHRGSFDTMDSTYDAMTNHLDEKRLDVRDLYVEEYTTDPLTTPKDDLRVFVYVFPN